MLSVPFNVAKSVFIEKPVDEVFKTIGDFSKWRQWSPWLCIEPDCDYSVSGEVEQVGHRQEWSGRIIGAGNMTVTAVTPNSRIQYALLFLKPWKSHADVQFVLSSEGSGTKVVWQMQSALPIFLFFMKKGMAAAIGRDFERGLSMLKEYVETGGVKSAIRIAGVEDRKEMFYVGKRRTCSMRDMGETMIRDLQEMNGFRESNRVPQPESVFTLYHRFDPMKEVAEYTAGFVYSAPPAVVDESMVSGRLPDHNALRVTHEGAYRHLGNAWAAAMGCARSGHKRNKSVPMYEIYTDDPHSVSEKAVKTDIYLPIRP